VIGKAGIDNLIVIATKHKMRGLKSLRVDTGDTDLDDSLRGYIKVMTDYGEKRMVRLE
jgi:NAD+ kinase